MLMSCIAIAWFEFAEYYCSSIRQCVSMVKCVARYRSSCVLCGWPIYVGSVITRRRGAWCHQVCPHRGIRLGKLDTRPWIPRGGWSMMPVSCTSPGSLWLLARGDVPDALLSLTTLIGRSDWIGAEYSASDLAAYVDAFLVAEENGDVSVVRRRRKVWKRGILRSPE